MAKTILVIGASGSGKSRSLKNFNENELAIIKCVNKDLPFKNKGNSVFRCDYEKIKAILTRQTRPVYAIDDANYLMTEQFMHSQVSGYDKFNVIGQEFYDLIQYCQNCLRDDITVYIIMHEDINENTGVVKPKTVGKMLDEKVCVEGMFTTVLRCINESGNHKFYSNNNGCAKSPEDMFESVSFENDLKYVDTKIREYYDMPKLEDLIKPVENGKETKGE